MKDFPQYEPLPENISLEKTFEARGKTAKYHRGGQSSAA